MQKRKNSYTNQQKITKTSTAITNRMFSRGDEKAQNVRQPTDCCRRANVTANTSLISYLTHWERLVHTNKDT